MLWHAMPPELNTARLMAGAGPAPMLAAAAGWQTLSAALDAQAVELTARLNSLGEAWTGGGSDKALAAATPDGGLATNRVNTGQDPCDAGDGASRGIHPGHGHDAVAAGDRRQPHHPGRPYGHQLLRYQHDPDRVDRDGLFHPYVDQAALAMEVYQAETAVNTLFEKLEPMASILDPGASQSTTNPIFGMPSPGSSTPVGQLPPAATQTLGQLGEMSGPMQQLTQPLQQLTSLFSQVGGTGGGNPADEEAAQMGLLGTSPLSNHPLAGGSGPSAGAGLLRAESLPGAGGSLTRTPLMSQLIEKPVAPSVMPAAAAGSSATGGAAPVGAGAMGQGAQSGGSTRPGLVAPAPLAQEREEDDEDDWDEEDDW